MPEQVFYIHINGQKIEVSKKVYQEYYRGERKERYFSQDLKQERMVVDQQTQTITVMPSREDSYERLLEIHKQFSTPGEPLEMQVVDSLLIESALQTLSDEERTLIYELFYLDRTEREVSAALNMARSTLQRRRNQALKKLRELLEKEF